MPWNTQNYPPSYKNQPDHIRDKAVAIANALLREGNMEGTAIAVGLKLAREHFAKKEEENNNARLKNDHDD